MEDFNYDICEGCSKKYLNENLIFYNDDGSKYPPFDHIFCVKCHSQLPRMKTKIVPNKLLDSHQFTL